MGASRLILSFWPGMSTVWNGLEPQETTRTRAKDMPIVTTDAGPLYYEESGAGPPLVFLPGLGGDVRAFSVIARHLSMKYRVFVFDPRDAGRSVVVTSPYTTADMALDVLQALERLAVGSVHLVGHSLGGLIAQEAALQRPDMIASLVLACSHAGADDWRKAVIQAWISMRRRFSPAEFSAMTLPLLVARSFYKNHAQIEGLIRFAERNEWPQDAEAFVRQAKAASAHDLREQLDRIQSPTLVVAGAEDLVNPLSVATELSTLLPSSSLVVIDKAGHMPHIERGPEFREVVSTFLSQFL